MTGSLFERGPPEDGKTARLAEKLYKEANRSYASALADVADRLGENVAAAIPPYARLGRGIHEPALEASIKYDGTGAALGFNRETEQAAQKYIRGCLREQGIPEAEIREVVPEAITLAGFARKIYNVAVSNPGTFGKACIVGGLVLSAGILCPLVCGGTAAALSDDVGGEPCWGEAYLEPTEETTPQESAEGIISAIKAKFNYTLEPYRGDAVLVEEGHSANVLYMLEPGQLCKNYEGAIAIDAETGMQHPKLWEGDPRTITGTSNKFDPATNLTTEIYLDDGTTLVPGNEAAIWGGDEGQLLVVGYK
ncbi:MAG: hypothetical protein ACP5E4_02170, partial [Candidatus Aenigmatarchaeota archaeon]